MSTIIDSHVHMFSGDLASSREAYFDDPGFRLLYESKKAKIASYPQISEMIDKNELESVFALAFPWADEKTAKKENEYILQSADSSAGKIIPFGMIALHESNPAQAVHRLAKEGFTGVGEIAFYTTGFGKDQKSFLQTILEECANNGLAVNIHVNEPVGHSYTGKYDTPFTDLIECISGIKTPIILSHFGGGLIFYETIPEIKEKLGHVYYDTAAAPFVYDSTVYNAAIICAGKEKILFGSDYPLIEPKRYIDTIRNQVGEESVNKILFENSHRIMK